MPTSFLKKSMAYLGLVDDYDHYDDYDNRSAPGATRQLSAEVEQESTPPPSRIRVSAAAPQAAPVAASSQVAPVRPVTSPSVKISTPET